VIIIFKIIKFQHGFSKNTRGASTRWTVLLYFVTGVFLDDVHVFLEGEGLLLDVPIDARSVLVDNFLYQLFSLLYL
jgi:hypothetical protein